MTASSHEEGQQPWAPAIAPVIAALAARGAGTIPHPGGTLLAHLQRVGVLLDQWGARPLLRSAGLCHAWYGTDAFDAVLGEVDRRTELAALIGEDAEQLVYFYASCDRSFSHPHVAQPEGLFRDRFTGRVRCPPVTMRQDFAELTVANELDIAVANPRGWAQYGAELCALFAGWKDLLSVPAWQAVQAGHDSIKVAARRPGSASSSAAIFWRHRASPS